jgi:predicted transcriptional regulator
MDAWQPTQELSKYNRYILDKIIAGFEEHPFNIYELIREAVSYKCILPSQNELVMDTYYNIAEYLLKYEFIIEKKEMSSYILTSKGIELKKCGSIEKYEELYLRKNKKSFLHALISKMKTGNEPGAEVLAQYYE